MTRRWEPAAARRASALTALATVITVVVVAALVLVGVRSFAEADCVVSARGRTVELSSGDARVAADIAARSQRRGLPLRTTSGRLVDRLDLDPRDARAVASALAGRSPQSLTCGDGGSAEEGDPRLDAVGLTRRAAAVRTDLKDAFGRQSLGGFAPGGVTSGHMPGSAHYEGRALDVFVRPVTDRNRTRGWAMAHYLVAKAETLEVATVIFDGRIWTARRAGAGWRSYRPDTSGRSAAVAAILEHRDHVHVDVSR